MYSAACPARQTVWSCPELGRMTAARNTSTPRCSNAVRSINKRIPRLGTSDALLAQAVYPRTTGPGPAVNGLTGYYTREFSTSDASSTLPGDCGNRTFSGAQEVRSRVIGLQHRPTWLRRSTAELVGGETLAITKHHLVTELCISVVYPVW